MIKKNHSASNIFETISCPLCGASENKIFRISKDRLRLSQDDFKLVKCEKCSLVFQNPRIKPEEIYKFYHEYYFKSRQGRHNNKNDKNTDVKLSKILKQKVKLIKNIKPNPSRILEVGSANGEFLYFMNKEGWKVKGVEVSNDAVNYSKNKFNLDIYHGELVDIPLIQERFDVIVFWAVLPHIHNPVETLHKAVSLLNKNGLIIILAANIESNVSKIMKSKWGHLDQPRHYCMWSPKTIRLLFEKVNLNHYKTIFNDDIYNSNYVISFFRPIISSSIRFNSKLIQKLFSLTKRITIKINKFFTYPLIYIFNLQKKGGIMIVIGRK